MPRAKSEKVKGSCGQKKTNVIGGTSVADNALSTSRTPACVEVNHEGPRRLVQHSIRILKGRYGVTEYQINPKSLTDFSLDRISWSARLLMMRD